MGILSRATAHSLVAVAGANLSEVRFLERRPAVIAYSKFFCTFAVSQASASYHCRRGITHHWRFGCLAQTCELVAGLQLSAACILLFEKSRPGLDPRHCRLADWVFLPGDLGDARIPGSQRTPGYSLSLDVPGVWALHSWLWRHAFPGSGHSLDPGICVVRGS